MRSSLSRSLRHCSCQIKRRDLNHFTASGARWSSNFTTGTTNPDSDGHRWSTPLAKQLAEAITTTGPIPVASFMRQCLTSDLGGYYTSTSTPSDRDQFGTKGDFVTSPEISQIFGELVGIWIIAEWIAQGRRREGVYLMEVGPGRGTLMYDILRTVRRFPDFVKAVERVYLVEASPKLREAQHRLLCGDAPLTQNETGWESVSEYLENGKVVWTEDVRFIPRDGSKTPFIVAHEFFDALPIHVFQSVAPQAQRTEQAVSIGPSNPTDSERSWSKEDIAKLASLRVDQGLPWAEVAQQLGRPVIDVRAKYYELAMPETQQAKPRLKQQSDIEGPQWRELVVSPKPPHRLKEGEPEFELTMSKAPTPHSMYLPETSERYRALRTMDGATIEISPESQAYARDFAIRIGGSNPPQRTETPLDPPSAARTVRSPPQEESVVKPEPSGAALIIDYGPASTIPANSLRGIKQHQRVSPFHTPGTTDVSADVDFLALAEAAINGSPGVEVHGPVDQARFLTSMGIQERAAQLIKRALDRERSGAMDSEKTQLKDLAQRVDSGWRRLIDQSPQGMGRLYHVLAIIPHIPPTPNQPHNRRRPVGFGGDISL